MQLQVKANFFESKTNTSFINKKSVQSENSISRYKSETYLCPNSQGVPCLVIVLQTLDCKLPTEKQAEIKPREADSQ